MLYKVFLYVDIYGYLSEKVTYILAFQNIRNSKGSYFYFQLHFAFVYNSSQYCDTNSRLNKEKLTVGGSLKSSIVNSAIWH